MKKVKSILFQLDLEGNGIVNYDSNEQSRVFWGVKEQKNGVYSRLHTHYKNASYAQKNFYYDENGNLDYKIKISSDCLRNSMYKDELVAQTPNIFHNENTKYSHIASPQGLVRGYSFFDKEREVVVRKSPLTICDAEQTNNALSYLDFKAKSGEKTSNDGETDKSDNTLFKKENVGKITYQSEGFLDLMELQFVSADPIFNRFAFNPDNFEMYKNYLGLRLKNFKSNLGYYQLKTSSVNIPEYGVLLSEENVLDLVKDTLIRLLSLTIKRKDAYSRTKTLKIKLVIDATSDLMNKQDNWITIESISDIQNLNFSIKESYVLMDDKHQIMTSREPLESVMEKIIVSQQEVKKEKRKKQKV